MAIESMEGHTEVRRHSSAEIVPPVAYEVILAERAAINGAQAA